MKKFYKAVLKYNEAEIYAQKDEEYAYFSNTYWCFRLPLSKCIFDVNKFNLHSGLKLYCFEALENEELKDTKDLKLVESRDKIKAHKFDGIDINEKYYKEFLSTNSDDYVYKMATGNKLLVFEYGRHIMTIQGLYKGDKHVK